MPVDDTSNASLTLQVSSSSSAGLSADAREFVPKTKTRDEGNSNGVNKKKKHTGAVAKRPVNSAPQNSEHRGEHDRGSRRHQPFPPRYQKTSHGSFNGERLDSGRDGSSADNRKFYKDNQNYRQTSRHDGYYSARRAEPRHRYDYDEREEEHQKKDQTARKSSSTNHLKQKDQKKEKSIEPSKISQREQLIKDIESNSLECMICCDRIRDHQPVWSCTNCFHILHLNCIKTWITNSKTESGEWRCVACQYLRLETPKDYICFCGKQKYPAVNRNDLAHSCGEMCGRTDNCLHPCTLRCHPGWCFRENFALHFNAQLFTFQVLMQYANPLSSDHVPVEKP